MKAKKFDCVKMMHRGAEEVRKKIRRMTKKEQLAFWQHRSEQLRRRQSKAGRADKHEPSVP
jgi:hypothetical protein